MSEGDTQVMEQSFVRNAIQMQTLSATVLASKTRSAHWCSSSKSVTEVAKYSLIIFEVPTLHKEAISSNINLIKSLLSIGESTDTVLLIA